jgi:hypothetical protein
MVGRCSSGQSGRLPLRRFLGGVVLLTGGAAQGVTSAANLSGCHREFGCTSLRAKAPADCLIEQRGDVQGFLPPRCLDLPGERQTRPGADGEVELEAVPPLARTDGTAVPPTRVGVAVTVADFPTVGQPHSIRVGSHVRGINGHVDPHIGHSGLQRGGHGVSLTEAAQANTRSRDAYLSAQYRRLRARRGHKRAIGAVKHSIVVACWHMLSTGEIYHDAGGDYFTRLEPTKQRRRLVAQLERLGYTVTLQEAAA